MNSSRGQNSEALGDISPLRPRQERITGEHCLLIYPLYLSFYNCPIKLVSIQYAQDVFDQILKLPKNGLSQNMFGLIGKHLDTSHSSTIVIQWEFHTVHIQGLKAKALSTLASL